MSVSKGSTSSCAYPKSIFLIMATEFCERFSFCGLRTILSLYLRNILLFGENKATIIYHVFIMLCYFIPILGAVLADSFLGRFRTILYFGFIYAFGNILLCLSAVPPFFSQPILITMIGLLLIATGTGGIKPCVAAFGGDQFKMPQQKQLLEQFFSIYYFTINFGGLMGMVITPVLRTTVQCFQNDSCYALGFGFPAALMIVALLLFISGKQCYRIKSPKENIILNFVNCSAYAVVRCMNSKNENKPHWLDYAEDKYDVKLIRDMKTVLAILFLYIPLPLFWSLNDQQGSRWTFQASRTDGHVLGISVLPDQVQVINPAIVLVLIPFMEKSIYPYLESKQILTSPLQRMVAGGFISASSFVASGLLELKLEKTYPHLPGANESHINFVNLLPCSVQLNSPFGDPVTLEAGSSHVFKRVTAHKNESKYFVNIVAPYDCGKTYLRTPIRRVKILANEYEVSTYYIYEWNSKILTSRTSDNLQKTLSGKPKLRRVVIRDKNATGVVIIQLKNYRGVIQTDIVKEKELMISNDTELESGVYQYSISITDMVKRPVNGSIQLDCGGVYSLVVHHHNNRISLVKLYMMTTPNSVHMFWLLPQYFLISIGEAIFAIAGLQFTFTQAPKSLKTVTLAAWYLSIALGNLLIIIVTELHIFKCQANEFFFYAGLVIVDMLVFKLMTSSYKFVIMENDDTTSGSSKAADEVTLLATPILDDVEEDETE